MTRQEQFMLMIISILLVMKVRLTDGLLYTPLQMPPGNELCVRNGSTSKLILRVLTEEKGLDLYLDFNGRLLENPKGFRNNFLTLVYNTCTNSDVPDLFCLEIQATIAGKPYLNGYYLTSYLVGEWNSTGDPFTRMKQNVSTVMINVLSGVPVVDGPTANVSGSEAMQSHGTTDTDEYVLPGGVAYAASGYGLAGVSVLINGVLVALLVYTCRRNKVTPPTQKV